MSLFRSASFIIQGSTARSRFIVAVPTPADKRFSLKSSIALAVTCGRFSFPKHAARLRTEERYRFCVFGCWTVSKNPLIFVKARRLGFCQPKTSSSGVPFTDLRRITSVMLCDSFSAVVHPSRGYFSIAGLRLHRLQGFQIFDAKRRRDEAYRPGLSGACLPYGS